MPINLQNIFNKKSAASDTGAIPVGNPEAEKRAAADTSPMKLETIRPGEYPEDLNSRLEAQRRAIIPALDMDLYTTLKAMPIGELQKLMINRLLTEQNVGEFEKQGIMPGAKAPAEDIAKNLNEFIRATDEDVEVSKEKLVRDLYQKFIFTAPFEDM